MPDRPSRRRVVGLVALWAVLTGGVAVGAGCYGHNCDGDYLTFGRNAGEGELVGPDSWESTPVDSNWVPFTKQRVLTFEMPGLGDRTPYLILPYLSAEPNPVQAQNNWTIGAGNIAEQSGVGPGRIVLKNNTCADYYIRVVALAAPRPPTGAPTTTPTSSPLDASVDAEAGP